METPRKMETVSARNKGSQHYLPALDGWRGVAILMVLLAHGSAYVDSLPVDVGYTGVTLFFILSGFLITRRLLTAYQAESGILLRKFYVQRAFRLLPPLLVYLLVLGVLSDIGTLRVPREELVSALLFYRNYAVVPADSSLHGWFTGHFWSLAVEEHYYLLWPFTLHWAGRRRALGAALGAACCFAAWRWYGWYHPVSISYTVDHVPYFFRTDTRLDSLLLGSALGLVLSQPEWVSEIRRRFSPGSLKFVLAALAIVWMRFDFGYIRIPEEVLIAAVLMFAVLYPGGWLSRGLSWKPLGLIGKVSYGLYIWQQLFLVAPQGQALLGGLNLFPFNFVALSAATCASYFLIERPAIRLGTWLASEDTAKRTPLPSPLCGEQALTMETWQPPSE